MSEAATAGHAEDPHPPRLSVDAAIAAGLGTLAALLTFYAYPTVPDPPPVEATVAATVLLYGPLVWWRRRPLLALSLVAAGFLLGSHYAVPEGVIVLAALFLALVGAGAHGHPRWRTPVRAGVLVVILAQVVVPMVAPGWYQLADGDTLARQERTLLWAATFGLYNLLYFVAAWFLGDTLRARGDRERELATRTAELETEREENARRAVVDERLRIARDLHDVVAHHLSIISLQAGAARRALGHNPDRARDALAVVESSSGAAVEELQRLLQLLRSDDGADGREPQPGLDDLRDLTAQVATSLPVRLHVEGQPRAVPPSVAVSAYRVAQEALTNTLRHAQASQAELTVRYDPDAVEVEVVDDGQGRSTPAGVGTGHGLAGMRERVMLHRGELEAGEHDGGGFRVRARFPLPPQSLPSASTGGRG